MSLFMTLLALGEHSAGEAVAKLTILLTSLLAGVLGYWLLRPTKGNAKRLLPVK